jgi:hypothetical protein
MNYIFKIEINLFILESESYHILFKLNVLKIFFCLLSFK